MRGNCGSRKKDWQDLSGLKIRWTLIRLRATSGFSGMQVAFHMFVI